MGNEKVDGKGGGHSGSFFQLFERNKKPKWKKLLFSKSGHADDLKEGKLGNEKSINGRSYLIDDEKRSESSCFSSPVSSKDDEGVSVKAPSVVARLMGLESLPSTDGLGSSSVSSFEQQATHGPKKSLIFPPMYQNSTTVDYSTRIDSTSGNQRLQKFLKMPSPEKRPLDRFQSETLSAKPVKSYADIQHRLLSPIKNPGFSTAKNGAHIMENAVKLLEPQLHAVDKGKSMNAVPSSFSKDRAPSINNTSSYSIISKPLEVPKKTLDFNAVKCLQGQYMIKGWSGPVDVYSFREDSHERTLNFIPLSECRATRDSSPKTPFSSTGNEIHPASSLSGINQEEGKHAVQKNKGRSLSLAVQAKVNVQKRETSSACPATRSSSNGSGSMIFRDDHEPSTSNRSSRSQLTAQKKKQKQTAPGASNVLRQNNQKQNRLSLKSASSCQPSRKDQTGNSGCEQKHTGHVGTRDRNPSGRGTSNHSRKTTCLKSTDTSSHGSSENERKTCLSSLDPNSFPRKKRSIEGGRSIDSVLVYDEDVQIHDANVPATSYMKQLDCNKRSIERGRSIDSVLAHEEAVKIHDANVAATSYKKQSDLSKKNTWNVQQDVSSNSKSMDVVSFTFTSPLASGSKSHSSEELEKGNAKKSYLMDSHVGQGTSKLRMSSEDMALPNGDTLSALLEKKLRELTSGIELATNSSLKGTNTVNANTVSILQDFLATLHSGTPVLKNHNTGYVSISDKSGVAAEADRSSGGGQLLDFKVKSTPNPHSGTQSGHADWLKAAAEEDHEHLTPVSVLDAALSTDSENSTDSSCSTNDTRPEDSCQSSTAEKSSHTYKEKELMDSASSVHLITMEKVIISEAAIHKEVQRQELEYIREIVSNSKLKLEDLAISTPSMIIDPHLFDRLESGKNVSGSIDVQKFGRRDRKLHFDCVKECIDSRYSRFSRGDCRSWGKGFAFLRGTDIAEGVYREMLGWRSMSDVMVDDILYKDMSSGEGRWLDFEGEECETAIEVEDAILDSLIEETVRAILRVKA